MLRLRAYEKLQNLVQAGIVKKTGKEYRGVTAALVTFMETAAELNAKFAAGRHQVLQLLVGPQAQHFLASAGGIAGFQVGVDDRKERLEFERGLFGKDGGELLSHPIRTAT